MEENIITIFYLVDDILKTMEIKDDIRAKICNAEILTIGYMAVRYFHGNYYSAHQFFMSMRPSYPIDYSHFIRRLNNLHYVIDHTFELLSKVFYKSNGSDIYSVDSFPEMYKLERASICNIYSHTKMKNAIQRSNMGVDKDYFIKRKLRKKIETVFSIITDRFGNIIKATSIDGFLTKLKLFLTAYSIDCFLKLSNDKLS